MNLFFLLHSFTMHISQRCGMSPPFNRRDWCAFPDFIRRHSLALHKQRETTKLCSFSNPTVWETDRVRLGTSMGVVIHTPDLHDSVFEQMRLRSGVHIQDSFIADAHHVKLGDVVGDESCSRPNLHAEQA